MKNKIFTLLTIAFLAFSVTSCETTEQTPEQEKTESQVVEKKQPIVEEDSEYKRSVGTVSKDVSEETFNADKAAILKKIEALNKIMADKNFNYWLTFIDNDSRHYWSNTTNLAKYTEKLPKEAKGIKLRSLEDYFFYVFIPSRKGRNIDEIRYDSATSTKAVQVRKTDEGTENVVYYNFVKVGNDWKVSLPRL